MKKYIFNGGLLLVEEIEHIKTSENVFRYFRHEPYAFFLDSALPSEKLGRYSILSSKPFAIIKSKNGLTHIEINGKKLFLKANPLAVLKSLLHNFRVSFVAEKPEVPFIGGAVGYFGYDLNSQIEKMPSLALDDLKIPDYFFGFYDRAIITDELSGRRFLVGLVLEKNLSEANKRARNILAELKQKLSEGRRRERISQNRRAANPQLASNFTKKRYIEAIKKVKAYIEQGDIFQANISQRFAVKLTMPPYELFKRLREINPAPFSAFLDFGELVIVSASPERFMRVKERRVETRPIKGTRPRSECLEVDRRQAEELISSEKDRAEHVMIVDVERNDLGRVCKIGTVKVPELMILESYATVHHLVSTITGILREECDVIDLIRASFPGGSITGAPKIRAMEIIEEIEPTKRGVYCGSIVYLGFDQTMDSSIVIRTFLVKDGLAYFQTGGGIVADSDPEAEYEETLDKAVALIKSLEIKDFAMVKA
jgi:para-aminobenzoate synthetase component 1